MILHSEAVVEDPRRAILTWSSQLHKSISTRLPSHDETFTRLRVARVDLDYSQSTRHILWLRPVGKIRGDRYNRKCHRAYFELADGEPTRSACRNRYDEPQDLKRCECLDQTVSV